MVNIDKAVIFPLFLTTGCHICGQMAQWYVNGGTLPCRCGFESKQDLEIALEYVRRYPEILNNQRARAQMARGKEAATQAEAQRLIDDADVLKVTKVWGEALDALTKVVLVS